MIEKNSQYPVLIGGYWNLTPSSLPVDLNPDTSNMTKIPNEHHSKLLQKLQLKFSLVDPFRVFFPNKREFSYIPRDGSKNNRSRIDFFLFSRKSITNVSECYIADSLQNRLFDHKAVFFSCKEKKNCLEQQTLFQKLRLIAQSQT
jgi:exonuclease III